MRSTPVVRNDEAVRKTDNLLTRAQVAVYPVDARGVFNNPSRSVLSNDPSGQGGSSSTVTPPSLISRDDQSAKNQKTNTQNADSQMALLQQVAQENETMQAMAEDTGGHAFINSNNLAESVSAAIENGSNYYTLTYTPTNLRWDGRFRAIKVKVAQPGVKLAYREGYYADDPYDRNKVIAGSSGDCHGGTGVGDDYGDDAGRARSYGDTVKGADTAFGYGTARGQCGGGEPDQSRSEGEGERAV